MMHRLGTEAMPEEALELITNDKLAQKVRIAAADKLFKEALEGKV